MWGATEVPVVHRPVRPLLDGVERVYSHHLLNPVLDAGSDIWLRMNLRWVARGGGIPAPLPLRTLLARCGWDSTAS